MLGAKNYVKTKINRRLPENYMQSDAAKKAMHTLVSSFERLGDDQRKIDLVYEEVIELLTSELMFAKGERVGQCKSTPYKPYWNAKLSKLWHEVKGANKFLSPTKMTSGHTNTN